MTLVDIGLLSRNWDELRPGGSAEGAQTPEPFTSSGCIDPGECVTLVPFSGDPNGISDIDSLALEDEDQKIGKEWGKLATNRNFLLGLGLGPSVGLSEC